MREYRRKAAGLYAEWRGPGGCGCDHAEYLERHLLDRLVDRLGGALDRHAGWVLAALLVLLVAWLVRFI